MLHWPCELTPILWLDLTKLRVDDRVDSRRLVTQAAQLSETFHPRLVLAGLGEKFFSQSFAYQDAQRNPAFRCCRLYPPKENIRDFKCCSHRISIVSNLWQTCPTVRPDTIKKSPLTDTVPDILARIVVRKRE